VDNQLAAMDLHSHAGKTFPKPRVQQTAKPEKGSEQNTLRGLCAYRGGQNDGSYHHKYPAE
jgi:hypothetical protein